MNNGVITCNCALGYYNLNGNCVSIPRCPSNANWNVQLNSCICVNQDEYISNGNCIKCGINELWNGLNCVCRNGYSKTQGICSNCPSNTLPTYNNGVVSCNCASGYYSLNGNCVLIPRCPNNANWNTQTNLCICINTNEYIIDGNCIKCGINELWNGVNCVCRIGYFKTQGICNNCSSNTLPTLNNGVVSCNCVTGYYNQNGNCVSIPRCPNNANWNTQTNLCVCINSNEYISNGNCIKCGINEIWNGVNCVCQNGYSKTQGVCNNCPSNTLPTYNNGVISCNCASGYYSLNGNCVSIPRCPNNANWNTQTNLCVCINSNEYIINGNCAKCGINELWNGVNCVCRIGYSQTQGICNNCPSNSFPVINSNGLLNCTCISGYTLINALCVINPACGAYQIQSTDSYGKSLCICITGYILDASTNQCVIANQIQCPTNSVFSQDKLKCVCSRSNEYLINNICQTCGSNQGWNG